MNATARSTQPSWNTQMRAPKSREGQRVKRTIKTYQREENTPQPQNNAMYNTMNDFNIAGRKTNELNHKNNMMLDSPSPQEFSVLTPGYKKPMIDFKKDGSNETFENLTTAGPSVEPGLQTQREIYEETQNMDH